VAFSDRQVLPGANAFGLNQLKMTSQFDAVLVDLVTRLAARERGQQRICQILPRYPEQFLQSIDVSDQNLQFVHARFAL